MQIRSILPDEAIGACGHRVACWWAHVFGMPHMQPTRYFDTQAKKSDNKPTSNSVVMLWSSK